MFKNPFGNNLLYLLSEKKILNWQKFKKNVDLLKKQNDDSSNQRGESRESTKEPRSYYSSIARSLSSLGYLDIGESPRGETVVQIAPPMLVELPFISLSFLLTGARSPDFLETIKNALKGCSEIKKIKEQDYLPDTFIIETESKTALKERLEKTLFQGNKLSSYIKISDQPASWNILEFSGNIKSYNKSLESDWFSGNESDIQKIFDTDTLEFKSFQSDRDRLVRDLSLVQVPLYDKLHKYYLFSKEREERVKVDRDWGRFLVSKRSDSCVVLTYNKQTFELSSFLQLPLILERGLVLLSGIPYKEKERDDKTEVLFFKIFLMKQQNGLLIN